MIDVARLVVLPDATALESAAGDIVTAADKVGDAAEAASTSWSRIVPLYTAPEDDRVHRAMETPVSIANGVHDSAVKARTALETFTATLSGLAARRANLVDDIAEFNALPEGGDPGYLARLLQLDAAVDRLNLDFTTADADCAASIRRLSKYSDSIPKRTADAADSQVGNAVQSAAAETMNRYYRLYVPVPGVQLPDFHAKETPTAFIHNGTEYVVSSQSQLFIPRSSVSMDEVFASTTVGTGKAVTKGFTVRPSFTVEPTKATSSGLRTGSKALGAAGAALTLFSTYLDQYKIDKQAHPEWSESKLRSHAVKAMGVVGGTSIMFAAVGSEVGAYYGGIVGGAAAAAAAEAMGGTLGTFIVPGVGTVIGAIIGGVIVGVIAGGVGESIGQSALDSDTSGN